MTAPAATTTQLFSRAALSALWSRRDTLDSDTREAIDSLYKARTPGGSMTVGEQNVIYKLSAKKAGLLGYGRLYGPKSSLEHLQSECRATLCRDLYHDLDIVNAQPTLLAQLARSKLGRDMPILDNYIDDRETVLAAVQAAISCSRDEAKQAVISVLYNPNGACRCELLKPLQAEVRTVCKDLCRLPEYAELFEALRSEKNHYGSFLAFAMQTEERRVMLAMRDYLLTHGWSPDVLAYDGVMVRKRDGLSVSDELLAAISAACEASTGYRIQVKEKPLVGFNLEGIATPTPGPDPLVSLEDYRTMKAAFESRAGWSAEACKFYYIEDDDQIKFLDREAAFMRFGPLYTFAIPGKFEGVPFFPLWLKDPSRTTTVKITIDPSEAGPGVLVLPFKPTWQAEEPPADAAERVAVFRAFTDMLIPDEELRSCFLQWLAQLIQEPFRNSLTCPILAGTKGCGKDTMGDFICKWLLGRKYAINYDSNEIFWNQFDVGRYNRLLAKLEEASGAANATNEGNLKSRVTACECAFNPKHGQIFNATNYCRLLMTTNEANPVKMDEAERRFLLIHCGTDRVGDMDYWRSLRDALFCLEGAAAVGKWLSEMDCGSWPRVLPKGALAEAMIEDEKSVEQRWVESDDPWPAVEASATELYPGYKAWCLENSYIPSVSPMTFGKRLATLKMTGKVVARALNGKTFYRRG